MGIVVRDATASDMVRVRDIYASYVIPTDLATFEETAPDVEEMERRRQVVLSRDFPYLVAIDSVSDLVVGYCYANLFNTRSAYRFTAENSVYVDPKHRRKGVGYALMNELLDILLKKGVKQVIGVLGTKDDNPGSYHMHSRLGFKEAALLKNVGYKNGQWIDRVWMQKSLDPSLPL
jgi:L-amino acid N-acyltransferase YncA